MLFIRLQDIIFTHHMPFGAHLLEGESYQLDFVDVAMFSLKKGIVRSEASNAKQVNFGWLLSLFFIRSVDHTKNQ